MKPATVSSVHCDAPAVCRQSSPVQASSHCRPWPQTRPKSAISPEPRRGTVASRRANLFDISFLLCHSKTAMSTPRSELLGSDPGHDLCMRVLERLEELYAIGGGPGANRGGRTADEDQAHDLAAGWMRDAGMKVEVDSAGKLIGRTQDADVWTGSHLDSVPEGGKFDGALGVVAAIEAVDRVRKGAVVVFRDEERGCAGSSSFVERGDLPACFLEVHVEQGPVLERSGAPVGLTRGIVRIVRGERIFVGEPGHAGTVPMAGRRDALIDAVEYILRVRDLASGVEGAVGTVGQVDVEPGAANVIPGRVRISVDVRAPD